MKNIKNFENFTDKMRDIYAEPIEIPEPEENEIEGEKIGRIKDLEELEGKILYDRDSEAFLYVNNYDDLLELCDKDQRVVESSPIPKPGESIPLEGYEDDLDENDDPKTGVYLEDYCSFIEWFKDGKVTAYFSLKDAIDVSDIVDL
jgi:hypothetical protein